MKSLKKPLRTKHSFCDLSLSHTNGGVGWAGMKGWRLEQWSSKRLYESGWSLRLDEVGRDQYDDEAEGEDGVADPDRRTARLG